MSHRCRWGAVHPNTIAADIGSVIATARRRAITRTRSHRPQPRRKASRHRAFTPEVKEACGVEFSTPWLDILLFEGDSRLLRNLSKAEKIKVSLASQSGEGLAMGADCSFLAGKPGDPGRPAADNRLFLEAVLRIARTGASRRDLPDPFGLWNSVFRRFRRWTLKGVCRIGEFFQPGRARRELFSALS